MALCLLPFNNQTEQIAINPDHVVSVVEESETGHAIVWMRDQKTGWVVDLGFQETVRILNRRPV